MFHQIEGLVIDKDIHLGHLKWTLETLLKAFFERDDIVLRLRPSYFPSPSLRSRSTRAIRGRMVARGGRQRRCAGHSWMELLGSGMVNAMCCARRL
jgi:phenylalanyl-tRNA synthetase alpha chain